jgi:hypothetical protein
MDRDSLYYTEAVRQTREQEETRKHFDTMATNVLGFSAVILSAILLKQSAFTQMQKYVFIAVLLAFTGVAICTLITLWLRKWEFSPPLGELFKHMESLEYEDEALVLWAGQCLSDSITSNNKYLQRKAHSLRNAYVFLSLEVISVGMLIATSF